jgi:hypothetical protein
MAYLEADAEKIPLDALGTTANAVNWTIGGYRMECYRRAMIAEQTLEDRRENLNQSQQALSHLRDFDRGA